MSIPPIFWLDSAALGISTLMAASLLMISLGAGSRKLINVSFAAFALVEACWAVSALLLKLSLWLGAGRPQLLGELATFLFALLGPLMLAFTVRYLGQRNMAADVSVLAGFLLAGVLGVPLFQHRLVGNPRLAPNGTTLLEVSLLGMAAAAIPVFFLVWSLSLFIKSRRLLREPFMSLSVGIFITGLVVGGLAQVPFPVLSVTNTLSMLLLGYGVVSRGLFNPLREITEALRERARRLELLASVGQKTTAILELSEVLHQAISLIRAQFAYFNVSLLLVEGPELVLRAAAAAEIIPYEDRLRLAIGREGITGWVAAKGEPLLVPDVSRDPRFVKGAEEVRTKSELAVPIKLKGEVIGVLDAQSAELDAFSSIDVFTLQTVADQLAIAIENARLYAETRKRAERLAVVNRIAAAAGATLSLADLMEAVYREVSRVFQADAFFIALYDEAANELDFRFQIDEGLREPPARQKLGSGLSSLVVREKRPLLIREFERERSSLPLPEVWGTMKLPASWLGVPMRLGERVIGVICVQAYRPDAYGQEEQQLLSTLADQVAVAVENARLYEAAQAELAERKAAEEVLRESEEKFRNLAEESPNMIFINRRGRVIYANRRCEELLGYSREEFYAPGFTFMSLIAPEFVELLKENYRRHLKGEDIPPYEYALLTKEGKRIEAILASRLIRYGGETAILGIVTDIANRKRIERLLHGLNAASLAMERTLTPEQIFPTMGEELKKLGFATAVFLTDEGGGSLSLQYHSYGPDIVREVARITGLKSKGFTLQIGDIGVFHSVVLERKTAFIDGVSAVREVLPGPLKQLARRIMKIVGIPRCIAAPLIVEESVIGLVVVQSDALSEEDIPAVTAYANQIAAVWRKSRLMRDLESSLQELKRAQSALIQSQKMEAIGRLAGGIAHDFNNLLTAIGGYTELLLDRFTASDPAHSDLEEIKKATVRAGSLTRQLLAFSRKQLLQPKVLDLNEVLGNMEQMLRRLLGEHIELITVRSPALGRVRADPLQIEQVILNLAINGADAMPKGGRLILETANIELEGDVDLAGSGVQPGPYVMLAVSDTGVGMDRETLSRMFEPFFTTKEQGTGLGLSTVYGIIKQSGGHVEAYSKPGYGSTFKVYLSRVDEVPSPSPSAAPAGGDLRGTETVLLVEDEAMVRELARRILAEHGYTVLEADRASEALRLCRERTGAIHLVVTDVVMPGGMSGRELAEKLDELRPASKVLYISGYTASANIQRGVLDPGVHFLQKPFGAKALARKVREVLDG